MKKALLISFLSFLCLPLFSQLLSWSPDFPVESTDPFVITVDASRGNKGLDFYTPTSDVYVHTGVITNYSTSASNWRYVKFNQDFNQPNAALNATYVGSFPVQKWQFTITGGLRAYYGITDPTETIQKIAILFRNGNGSKVQRNADGSDMYIPVYDASLQVKFTVPFYQPTYNRIPEPITKALGDNIALTAVASSAPAGTTMNLYLNGVNIQTAANASTISANPVISTPGNQVIVAEAIVGATVKKDTIRFFVPAATDVQPLPAGVKDGINYEPDNTAATLVLYAPGKTRVSVIGEMPGSNWTEQTQYQMKKTPDGNYWWLRITGLTPGAEYGFQYLVNGTLKIGDAYTEKVLDPYNDQYISGATYPGLKAYPTGMTTGVVSILQTAAPVYNWQTSTFSRPDKRNLMIYELLVRDYLAAHDWKTLTDTLNYIKKLGINTIELLPINEFEGNISWGYNPDYYFAPDKYYGPKNELKAFVDSCHARGIAVVMDIALNHSFGLSPMVQLYFDNTNNRPAADNPWFNQVAKHAYNVGYDMNHESLATRYFTSRVVSHWLTEYKMDGFRFDLSKGFTQTQTCDANGQNCNEAAMANYDASRIAIWKRYYDTLQLKSPGSYAILEHFAANSEEKELSDYGMLLWGNMNYNFSNAAKGNIANSDFDGALHINRGWTNPYLVSYMESHDEERLMVNALQSGLSSGAYDIKNFETALDRMEMNAAFLLTIPGPKMIWQFGELGYDYGINYCQNGTTNNACRTDPKPIKWDYLQVQGRKDLHDVYAALLRLRNNSLYSEAFTAGTISRSLAGAFKWMTLNSSSGKLVVIGNFDVVAQTASVTFPAAGTWYNYLNAPGTFSATGAAQSFTLQPGEYRVYVSTSAVLPVTILNFNGRNSGVQNDLSWQVENEINLSRYELQRSSDGIQFSTLSSILATGSKNYSYADLFIDKSPLYFYRLKKIDIDGSFSYSTIIKLTGLAKNPEIKLLSNPFKDGLKLQVTGNEKTMYSVSITDLRGNVLLKQQQLIQPGVNSILINGTEKFSPGMYILKIQTGNQNVTMKIIKAK